MSTVPIVTSGSFFRQIFGVTFKNAAVLFALMYATGFLVVSVHHAHFGLDTSQPFKAKVLSAGALFVFLTVVPCIAMARRMGMFGLRTPLVETVEGRAAKLIVVNRIMDFWIVALGLRVGSAFLFTSWELFPRYPGSLVLFICWLLFAINLTSFSTLNRSPVRTTVASFVFFVVGFATMLRYSSHEFFLQVFWFYSIGLIFQWLSWERTREGANTFDWERQVFSVFGAVTLFAAFVYGHIHSAYGGGAPIPIDLLFTHPTAFSSHTTDTGFLIDQDDHGFYVVRKVQDIETHFIPRDAVSSVVFHGYAR